MYMKTVQRCKMRWRLPFAQNRFKWHFISNFYVDHVYSISIFTTVKFHICNGKEVYGWDAKNFQPILLVPTLILNFTRLLAWLLATTAPQNRSKNPAGTSLWQQREISLLWHEGIVKKLPDRLCCCLEEGDKEEKDTTVLQMTHSVRVLTGY